MEHESHHHHHPHGTGLRWLDISLAVAAAIVSLVSLWLGLHSAHSMEKLVASNSYPYVELASSKLTEDLASKRVEYILANNGVGPARIEWVELRYKDVPVADLNALFEACCKLPQHDFSKLGKRGGIANSLIPPGTSISMFKWDEPATPNQSFAALHAAMGEISFSACYCSVFDDCYVRSSENEKPKPVEQCTAPEVGFRPSLRQG